MHMPHPRVVAHRGGWLSVLLLALLSACGEPELASDQPGAQFPVRLFTRGAPGADALFWQDFALDASLDHWRLLIEHEGGARWRSIEEVGGSVRTGVLSLPPLRGVLLRTLTLPPGRSWMAHVQLGSDAPDLERTPLWLLALSASGPEQLLERLPARLASLQDRPGGRIQRVDAQLGLVEAEHTLDGAARERVGVLMLPLRGEALRMMRASVVAGSAPSLRDGEQVVAAAGSSSEGAAAASADAVFGLKLGGDLRSALRVPRGGLRWSLNLPAGAERFSFAVARMPDTDGTPGWRVSLHVAGVEHAMGEQPPGDPDGAGPHFVDQTLDWPPELASGGAVRLTIEPVGPRPLVLAEAVVRGPPAAQRPNLLLVSLDTLRADHLGYHGYARDTSPFLDAFAEQHSAFLQHHSVSSYTLPTHASLFTGLHPLQHGAVRMYQRVPSHQLPYLPLLLARAGWATAAFTGGAIMSDDYGFGAGFDRFVSTDPLDVRDARADAPARGIERVAAWAEDRGDEPWFLFLHTFSIHNYVPPPHLLERFDAHPDAPWRRQMPGRLMLDWMAPGAQPTPDDVGHLVDLYDATIRYADQQLGRLMQRLERQGLLENTVVVITSDHGEEFWEHGGLAHGLTLFEEQLHVPLLVSVPGAPARRVHEPSSILDLAPTLLELLGLPPLPAADGRSLAPFLRGDAPLPPSEPVLAHLDLAVSRRNALQARSLKLHWGSTDPELRVPASAEWSLFDLSLDPGEQHDLADARPDDALSLQQLMAALQELLARGGRRADTAELGDDVLEQLRALGYVR
ncbi:MAG: hypothetical protein DRQ55_12330 [Planctomycetota bacterium]|nr:MAG: hypothetical protein DRQ55_12330 [Planctomycetota bacterium]